MRRTWLGLFSLVTRKRGEGKCLVKPCEKPIQVGEQYIRITKGVGSQRLSKTLHIDCLQSWIKFMVDRRSRAPERDHGRPPLELSEEHKTVRKSLHRKLRYVVKKMKVAAGLEAAEKLNADYWRIIRDIELTGAPYSTTGVCEARQIALGGFMTQLKSWRKQVQQPEYIARQLKSSDIKPLPVSTVFRDAVETPELSEERKAELDQQQAEILERVARGYVRTPEDEGGDYLA